MRKQFKIWVGGKLFKGNRKLLQIFYFKKKKTLKLKSTKVLFNLKIKLLKIKPFKSDHDPSEVKVRVMWMTKSN